MRIMSGRHLIETDRSGLVAGFVGGTAQKTKDVIRQALDGVLFIDEAYSLVKEDNSKDYGPEAIDALLKEMEDQRDRLCIIIAGYSNEMSLFVGSNPGLRSRFTRYIHFPDYDAPELLKLFTQLCLKNQITLEVDAKTVAMEMFSGAFQEGISQSGNGRFVRTCFEASMEFQALRLADSPDSNISTLTAEDVHLAFEQASRYLQTP